MTVKQENDQLLEFILNERFFKIWKEKDEDRKSIFPDTRLELFLTTKCNQKCEYCYLISHKDKLYPSEYDKPEIILNNLKVILDWMIEENFFIPAIDLFTGEIWEYKFGFDVLDILLDYARKYKFTNEISIPSNCSFLRDKIKTAHIQRYIKQFDYCGISLKFSISVDGKVIEDHSRPYADGSVKDDEFYENMFLFAAHNNFFFHPMVAACNIKYWKENFIWWENECEKYDMDPYLAVMMLEVRNNDWTDETIKEYNEFNSWLLERFLTKGTLEDFYDFLLLKFNRKYNYIGYMPFTLEKVDTFLGCTISHYLTIRVGDLAICPCHRTCYNKYLYGKFITENNKIVGLESNNTQMAIRILFSNNNLAQLGCDSCPFNPVCLKGCLGSQLENTLDPFLPIDNVCKFFKAKYLNLIKEYENLKVFEYCEDVSPYSTTYLRAQWLLQVYRRIKQYELGKN